MTTAAVTATPDISGKPEIVSCLEKQRAYFATGATRSIAFRKAQLRRLKEVIDKYEQEIMDALHLDLGKSPFEAYATEIGIVMAEIDKAISHIGKWAKPKSVSTSLFHFKASSHVYNDPYGLALIIAPWNYPFQLLMAPLVGSIAAGNCSVLKPSEVSEHTGVLLTKMIKEAFEDQYISIFDGGVDVSQALLAEKFDFIFFTGSTNVGKIIYQAAAKHLTPVVLELGGKSPCIIDKDIHLNYTAKRIAWGKLINAGQTCIAPDYLLVHKDIKKDLLAELKKVIKEFYSENPAESEDYCRIVSDRHFARLEKMLSDGDVYCGGNFDRKSRYIDPTILENVSAEDGVMQEEIFGPILPVLEYERLEDALRFVNERAKPLALYVFSKNKKLAKRVLSETTSGGGCINDTVMHISNDNLSFGGVGDSGIGSYHGQHSFEAFSHQKGIMDKSLLVDLPLRYAPYNKFSVNTVKQLFKRLF